MRSFLIVLLISAFLLAAKGQLDHLQTRNLAPARLDHHHNARKSFDLFCPSGDKSSPIKLGTYLDYCMKAAYVVSQYHIPAVMCGNCQVVIYHRDIAHPVAPTQMTPAQLQDAVRSLLSDCTPAPRVGPIKELPPGPDDKLSGMVFVYGRGDRPHTFGGVSQTRCR